MKYFYKVQYNNNNYLMVENNNYLMEETENSITMFDKDGNRFPIISLNQEDHEYLYTGMTTGTILRAFVGLQPANIRFESYLYVDDAEGYGEAVELHRDGNNAKYYFETFFNEYGAPQEYLAVRIEE